MNRPIEPKEAVEEEKPTKDELRKLGIELMRALKDIRAKHTGLEIVITYTLPRPGDPTRHALSIVSTLDNPRHIAVALAGGTREIKEQMIDPFGATIREKIDD